MPPLACPEAGWCVVHQWSAAAPSARTGETIKPCTARAGRRAQMHPGTSESQPRQHGTACRQQYRGQMWTEVAGRTAQSSDTEGLQRLAIG